MASRPAVRRSRPVMMGTKICSFAALPHDLSLDELVPEEHLYRLQAQLDLSLVRDLGGHSTARAADLLLTRSYSLTRFSTDCSHRQTFQVPRIADGRREGDRAARSDVQFGTFKRADELLMSSLSGYEYRVHYIRVHKVRGKVGR